jgi:predicted metal-binding membrane protein
VTLRGTTYAVAALLAASLACWIAAFRGMSMMGGVGPWIAAWATTMAAMMLPSAAPMVIAYTWLARERSSSTSGFVLGYLVAWTTFGLAAYVVAKALPDWSSDTLAGVGLLLAGAYQLTPLKNTCLRACRAPLGFVALRWQAGAAGALRMGLEHGVWCTGCCFGLMVALFVLGMSSIAAMAGVALVILVEKVHPLGTRIALVTGVAFILAGAIVLA